MTYKKKATVKRADTKPARYRVECSGCDNYRLCTQYPNAWLCEVCASQVQERLLCSLERGAS